jgi:hypothetical protein
MCKIWKLHEIKRNRVVSRAEFYTIVYTNGKEQPVDTYTGQKYISIVEHFEHNKLVSNFFTTKCSTPL